MSRNRFAKLAVKPEAQVLAFSVGLLGVINLFWQLAGARNLNVWWLDLQAIPAWIATTFLWATSISLLWFGIQPKMKRPRRAATLILTGLWTGVAAVNAVTFFFLKSSGDIISKSIIPFSLLVALAGIFLSWQICLKTKKKAKFAFTRAIIFATFFVVALPTMQIICFGSTDYRRPANVAIVFGAGVYPDGTLSHALSDRMHTAVELYNKKLVGKIIVSGGPGMGEISEPQAMRKFAIAHRVSPKDIICDEKGFDTRATIKNAIKICDIYHLPKILVVSQAYHQPRA